MISLACKYCICDANVPTTETKEPIFSAANESVVSLLILIGNVMRTVAIRDL